MVKRPALRRRRKHLKQDEFVDAPQNDENIDSPNPVGRKKSSNSIIKALLKISFYILFFFIFRAYNNNDNNDQTNEGKGKDDEIIQLMKSGNNTSVFVVQKFLPHDLALKLRGAIHHEWQHESVSVDTEKLSPKIQTKEEQVHWQFTTLVKRGSENNTHVGNEKIRSLDDISLRNKTARDEYNAGKSSFAAWELDPSHKLHTRLRNVFMKHNGAQKSIGHLLRWNRPLLSVWGKIASMFSSTISNDIDVTISSILDLSVTRISTGDFIFHKAEEGICRNDGESKGTIWNLIIFFTLFPNDEEEEKVNRWEADFGGYLRFNCPVSQDTLFQDDVETQWCHTIQPDFNKAVIFATDYNDECSNMLSYEIMPLRWFPKESQYRHYVVTIKFLGQ